MDWANTTATWAVMRKETLSFGIWCTCFRGLAVGQYHCCWSPGDTKNQAISRHGTYHTLLVFKFVQVKTMCVSSAKVMTIPLHDINSLAPGGFENIFQNVFFKLISWIDTLSNSCETALRSMPQNPSDDKSTLVQVMAWCRQAASHYLSQCCPKSLSPYGVTRPQWVNSSPPGENGHHFGKQHFHMNFLEWKWQNYDSNFSEICSLESNR